METVSFGRTGLKVSRLCFGTMGIGSSKWKPWVLDAPDSEPLLKRCLDHGITFFDMADWYSTGENERVILALGEGRFTAQEVVSGIESGDWVEIRRGLEEGDRVVTSGQFLIDSESSKTSDFQRMSASGSNAMDLQMDHSGHVMDPEKAEPKIEPEAMDHSSMNHGGGES